MPRTQLHIFLRKCLFSAINFYCTIGRRIYHFTAVMYFIMPVTGEKCCLNIKYGCVSSFGTMKIAIVRWWRVQSMVWINKVHDVRRFRIQIFSFMS